MSSAHQQGESVMRTRTYQAQPAATVLVVHGEVDMETAEALRAAADSAAVGAHRLIIDLSEVTFLASAGLAVLVAVHQGNPVPVQLVSSRHATVRALEVTGLDQVLPVFSTLADALESH